jgi:hypothetical protein
LPFVIAFAAVDDNDPLSAARVYMKTHPSLAASLSALKRDFYLPIVKVLL